MNFSFVVPPSGGGAPDRLKPELHTTRIALLAGWLALAVTAGAAEPTRGDPLLADYFRAETARLAQRCLADIKTLDDWRAAREKYREQLFEMLSLSPRPERGDLRPVITGQVEHDQFTVEKLHFQSLPGLYVTANLYLPKNLPQPAPTILYLCGHGPVISNGVSYGNKVAYQHHGAWFARHGYVCLTLDTLQLGEILGVHHGTYREGMWWWNARGYTPAGVEAWNSLRALDYLQTRREVDTNRFGVTGRSGGGAYSWWIAALDDRIKAAAPVAGITDLQNHVVDGVVEGHCDCMFMVNTHRWDYPQVAALVAPRPLLIVNTDADSIFPLDGVQRTHAVVRRIYQLHKASDKLGLVIGPGPHKDTQDLQVPVFRWFNKHLKGEDPFIEAAATKFFRPEQLRVFDQLPADAINPNIHATFVPRAGPAEVPPSREAWRAQRDAWLSALQQQTFGGWTEGVPPLRVAPKFSVTRRGLRFQAYDFDSQPHVRLRLYVLHTSRLAKPERVVLTVMGQASSSAEPRSRPALRDESGHSLKSEIGNRKSEIPLSWEPWLGVMRELFAKELSEELRATALSTNQADLDAANEQLAQLQGFLQTNKLVLASVAPRGLGLTAWATNERQQIHLRRRFLLLGQTLDGMRVWDIRRAVQTVRTLDKTRLAPLWLQAEGDMTCDALYASLYEPDIARLDLWQLPSSHTAGPDFLNVLRVLDVPQAVAMAAERSVVRLHEMDARAWDFPRSVATVLGWDKARFVAGP